LLPDRADLHEADCHRAISKAVSAYADLCRPRAGRQSLRYLATFRNEALAHIRIDAALADLPRYNELFQLVDVAKAVVGGAMMAVLGKNSVFE
jgi:hypothetical protein